MSQPLSRENTTFFMWQGIGVKGIGVKGIEVKDLENVVTITFIHVYMYLAKSHVTTIPSLPPERKWCPLLMK